MKSYLILIIAGFMMCSCQLQRQEMKNHPFVSEFINSLNGDQKTLIVEFWSPTCGTCIKLKNDILDNDQILDFLNENFVLLKVSPEDSVYKSLFNYYNLQTQSTVLFFDNTGNEIERSVAYDGNKESYMAFLNSILKRENLFVDVYNKYLEDKSDIEYNYLMANKLQFRCESLKANKLFKFIIEKDPLDTYGFHSECKFRIAEYDFLTSENIDGLKSYVDHYTNNNFTPQAYIYLVNYYKKNEDHKNSVLTSGEALRKFPHNPDLLNKHAWNIYLFKIKEDYTEALEMAEEAIQLNSGKAGYWDTQAWLYYELGETSKAVQSEKKAVQIFPHQAYINALKQFESI